ncbi:MAG: hypothetical protein RL885_09735 [Planctomycetota bacterium]
MRSRFGWLALWITLAAGCRTTPDETPSGTQVATDSNEPAPFPVWETGKNRSADEPTPESRFEFLTRLYDADEDGRVTAEEYGREPETFARMDRDEDGVLTAEDFAEGQPLLSPSQRNERRRRLAAELFAKSFQQDDDLELGLEEVEASFRDYDADGDGAIVVREFARHFATLNIEPPRGAPPGFNPFPLFRAEIARGDDQLTMENVRAYFVSQDKDGDGRLVPARRAEAPKVGELAPDFTLSPPKGGDPVTLSSFRGDRPVALIFGSYT